MKLLEKIKNYKNKIRLLKLVNDGHKTGAVFGVGIISNEYKEILLLELKKIYPNNQFYFHPKNESFLEFYNINKFESMIRKSFPEWIGLTNLEIIKNKLPNVINPLAWEKYYGLFFDIPTSCINEFNYSQVPKKRKYIRGFGGEICVYYRSEKAKNDAMKWIKKLELLG